MGRAFVDSVMEVDWTIAYAEIRAATESGSAGIKMRLASDEPMSTRYRLLSCAGILEIGSVHVFQLANQPYCTLVIRSTLRDDHDGACRALNQFGSKMLFRIRD